MISHKHHTIFVHIPKVAGQSIETLFLKDLDLDWQERGELLLRKKKKTEKGPFRLAHLSACQYVDLEYVSKDMYQDYFSFSFVRNPYNRTISLYNYLGYAKVIPFAVFLEKVVSTKVNTNHFFFKPQYNYLYSKEGKCLVDYIGRFENIENDIKYVVEKSNLSVTELPFVNKSKKELKRGISKIIKSPRFLKYIFSKQKRTLKQKEDLTILEKEGVYKLYKNDFKFFGYEK